MHFFAVVTVIIIIIKLDLWCSCYVKKGGAYLQKFFLCSFVLITAPVCLCSSFSFSCFHFLAFLFLLFVNATRESEWPLVFLFAVSFSALNCKLDDLFAVISNFPQLMCI